MREQGEARWGAHRPANFRTTSKLVKQTQSIQVGISHPEVCLVEAAAAAAAADAAAVRAAYLFDIFAAADTAATVASVAAQLTPPLLLPHNWLD